jgi:hypothetical protein
VLPAVSQVSDSQMLGTALGWSIGWVVLFTRVRGQARLPLYEMRYAFHQNEEIWGLATLPLYELD